MFSAVTAWSCAKATVATSHECAQRRENISGWIRDELCVQGGSLEAVMIPCGDINITSKSDLTHFCPRFMQPLKKKR